METDRYDVLKAKFLKLYASIPSPLRDEIIAVVGDDTFTWASAKAEIQHDDDPKHKENSKRILEQLLEMEVLDDEKV